MSVICSNWSLRGIAVFISAWIVLQLSGCATHKAYPGGEKSPDELAVLETSSDFAIWANRPNILTVDGAPGGRTRVEMTPGEHEVTLLCDRRFSTIFTVFPEAGDLKFNIEAGQKYRAYCSFSEDKVYYWIENVATGETVSGEKP